MSSSIVIILLFLIFIILIILKIPISFALIFATLPILFLEPRITPIMLLQRMMRSYASFILLSVPFFLLAANLMNESGITDRLIRFSRACWICAGYTSSRWTCSCKCICKHDFCRPLRFVNC